MKVLTLCCALLFADHVSAAITYQLYTRMNKKMGQPMTYKNADSINQSNFNSAKKNK